jgi:microcystin-dependent protein
MTTVFNKNDYKNVEYQEDDDSAFINRNGDYMNGALSMPYIILTSSQNPIHFVDGTFQQTAFNENNTIITNIKSDITQCQNDIIALSNNQSSNVNTTAITYYEGLLKTEIANNCYITNLTAGNINTSHLNNTTSNIQSQINDINDNKIKKINYNSISNVTILKGAILLSTDTIYDTNSQIQFNDLSIQSTAFTNDLKSKLESISYDASSNTINPKYINIINDNYDTTIDTLSQPDYSNYAFNNMFSLSSSTFTRNFYLGLLGNQTDNVQHFAIGCNAGGGSDPNIIFSLSTSSAYFYGVKQPLVPVGGVQIYAGLSNNIPTGYLLCNGASISQTTFSKLFSVIGNTYLNGRTSSSTTFYLPDLRGMFVRGVGTNTTYSGVAGALTTGTYQTSSVENHFHYYQRPNDAINVAAAGAINNSSVWDNQTGTSATSQETYNGTGTLMTDETRPHNISMNYIIKF